MNIDKEYWNEFYKDKNIIIEPSDFAKFVLLNIVNESLLDLGCGNGRDSLYFAQNGLNVTAIDSSEIGINCLIDKARKMNVGINTIVGDFTDNKLFCEKFDNVYSRFSIHAISEKEQNKLLANVNKILNFEGKFFIEVRSVKDELFGKGKKIAKNTYLYNKHCRRFIVLEELVDELIKNNFKVLYSKEKNDFAKFGDQNPIVIRIIAQKIR